VVVETHVVERMKAEEGVEGKIGVEAGREEEVHA
jgi:hypothetical protein